MKYLKLFEEIDYRINFDYTFDEILKNKYNSELWRTMNNEITKRFSHYNIFAKVNNIYGNEVKILCFIRGFKKDPYGIIPETLIYVPNEIKRMIELKTYNMFDVNIKFIDDEEDFKKFWQDKYKPDMFYYKIIKYTMKLKKHIEVAERDFDLFED